MNYSELVRWFKQNKRNFPWRENPSPYRVWISEIMLQQTRASVVIPYFNTWMARFPTVQDLAAAPIEEVIKLWEGLGYYSRARNIHTAAQTIVKDYGGNLPSDPTALHSLKGLGEYTVGAILSFAFHQKAAAVDGNVIRVLSRLHCIEDDIGKPKTIKEIRAIAAETLPIEEPWVVSEALIELGATLCQKSPSCRQCPLNTQCKAYQIGKEKELPYKAKKQTITKLLRSVLLIQCGDSILLQKGHEGKIMQDLYEFPYVDYLPTSKLIEEIESKWGIALSFEASLPEVTHSFTRYNATLKPHLFNTLNIKPIPNHQWIKVDDLSRLPFSSGHRKILHQLLSQNIKG